MYGKKLWIKNKKLVRITDYEPNAKQREARDFISKKPLNKKEAQDLKKALKQKKRMDKYDEQFEDLD